MPSSPPLHPVQYSLGKPSSPVKEGISLRPLELQNGRLASPGRSTRDLKAGAVLALLLAHLTLLLRGEEVGVVALGGEGRIGDDFDVLTFCRRRGEGQRSPTGASARDVPAAKSVPAS